MRKERRKVRKLRHWKQRWDRNAEFIFRRTTTYGGKTYLPGDPVPKALLGQPTKLRRFWESQRIELAQFEEPNVLTGQAEARAKSDVGEPVPVEPPIEGVSVERAGGPWFLVKTPDGETKVNGQAKLDEHLAGLRAAADFEDEDWLE